MIKLGVIVVCVAILIVIAIVATIHTVGEKIEEWYPRWRAMRAGVPENMYQPLNRGPATIGQLEFTATGLCPHCGKIDTHEMREPDADTFNFKLKQQVDGSHRWTRVAYHPAIYEKSIARRLGDRPDFATVRSCMYCGHIWGEK